MNAPTQDQKPQSPVPLQPISIASVPDNASGNKRWLRPLLLIGGPALVVLIGGYFYLTGGRYVETDNAYVKANKVIISTQVSGPVAEVPAVENIHVNKGDVLFKLDRAPFMVSLQQADARLNQVQNDIKALKVSYRQKQAEEDLAKISLDFAERDFRRQADLIEKKIVAQSTYDQAKRTLDIARQQINVAHQEKDQILARLEGDPDMPIEKSPDYMQAKAQRDQAALDLDHTIILAPFSGIASKVPEIGQYAESGKAVMSVVGNNDVWIEANFKETDLTNVKTGQPVEISVDTYPDQAWKGTVRSISQATGAEFSVLPPQNSSGNWVKVVQRIPVRINIDQQAGGPALRAGMSVTTEIDTGAHRRLFGFLAGSPAPASSEVVRN